MIEPTWQAGDVKLYLGDCLEILPTVEIVDACITDPPWMDYQTGWYDASVWHKPIKSILPDDYCSKFPREIKVIILWCRWDNFYEHAKALTHGGFAVKNCIVWDKGTHTAGDLNGNFGYRHEMAVFATKGEWHFSNGRKQNLWKVPHLFSKTFRYHPTEKPIRLMTMCIDAISKPGDSVLDPFMGSGTTGVACVQTGRKFVGIEIEPKYFDIAVKRIKEAQLQIRMEI